MNDAKDLSLIIQSRIPIVVIESREERLVIAMLARLSKDLRRPLYTWNVAEGLRQQDSSFQIRASLEAPSKPETVLKEILNADTPGIYVLCDYHPYLEASPHIVRLLKEIALVYDYLEHTIILVSHRVKLPNELRNYIATFEIPMPDVAAIEKIVRKEALGWEKANNGHKVKADKTTFQALVRNLMGLSYSDVRRLARSAIYDDGAITGDDLPAVNKAKFELLDRDSVLSFEYDTSKFSEVGGLEKLKQWLTYRKMAFYREPEYSPLDAPKGIMLIGVQGCGKSLAAKAVAGVWNAPLLRLDFAVLYNKFFGETERNLRKALKTADLMAPCVLWIDEIEKGIATGDYDSGTSRRILGTFLTWMAERKQSVFIVATANDISSLPPELLRKGRFDEIFFVDLPDNETRMDIFTIHLQKRGIDTNGIDVIRMAAATEGFSGAEIEQVVVAGLYRTIALKQDLVTEVMLEEIKRTKPLSVVMAEQVSALRLWAKNRTVAAH